jgi:AraC-like DNA-binding protein
MVDFVRSASLNGLADLLRAAGIAPARLAESCGVPARALVEPDLKLESAAVGRLLERAAEATGRADLGLRLAAIRRLSNLGPVGLIAREQPSLRRALDVLGGYMWLHNEALILAIEEGDEWVFARVDLGGDPQGAVQASDLVVGAFGAMLRDLLGEAWRPEAVLLRHAAPADVSPYVALFGVRPDFGAAGDGIVLARRLLDAPLVGADPALASEIERLIATTSGASPRSWRRRTNELIVLLLPTGGCTADRVAERLGFDRRTLHRRLAEEGTSFRALLDEARRDLALSLLRGRRPLAEIAELTGFAAQSAFSHWFRDRFGEAPSRMRSEGL